MTAVRLREVRIRGIRSVADVCLPLDRLTVLIGENGAGKSTILEVLELLRRATYPDFLHDLNVIHGGLFALGAPNGFELSVLVEKEPHAWRYSLRVGARGSAPVIDHEALVLVARPEEALVERRGTQCTFTDNGTTETVNLPSDQPALAVLGVVKADSAIGHVFSALQGIEVHVPFEVTPRWIGQAHNRPHEMRRSVHFLPAQALDRLGTNLPNVFASLRNQANWHETMDLVRMGLGLEIENVVVEADPGGGAAALSLKVAAVDKPIPAMRLAEGMLTFLCFVGLRQLSRPHRSLLAFDEPDIHLHPALLARVVEFFEVLAEKHPVVLATHSDALLDCLHDPARSVVVCELDRDHHTRLRQLDTDALDEWLADYKGVGGIRGDGYLDSVVAPRQGSEAGE